MVVVCISLRGGMGASIGRFDLGARGEGSKALKLSCLGEVVVVMRSQVRRWRCAWAESPSFLTGRSNKIGCMARCFVVS